MLYALDGTGGSPGESIWDVFGVGFGPANMALAIALREHIENGAKIAFKFADENIAFDWQAGMLTASSKMTTSFWEDLVTARNPKSQFTFLNYLHAQERLFEFMNLREFYPTRIEFTDYLKWCAAQLTRHVDYGRRIVAIRPRRRDGRVNLLEVTSKSLRGVSAVYVARTVVLGTGRRAVTPSGVGQGCGERIFHSAEFLTRIRNGFAEKNRAVSFHDRGRRPERGRYSHVSPRRIPHGAYSGGPPAVLLSSL